jgi:hypothetical protein
MKYLFLILASIPLFNVGLVAFSIYYWIFTGTTLINLDQSFVLIMWTLFSFFFAIPAMILWLPYDEL